MGEFALEMVDVAQILTVAERPQWDSDFIQKDFWAGPHYRKQRPAYVVYRY